MNVLQDIVQDLRTRRLWPLAVVLVIALVAVPVLLSSSPSSPAPAPSASAGSSAAVNPASSLPAVNVSNAPSRSRLRGRAHDPFAQQSTGTATPPTKPTTATTTTTPGGAATTGNGLAASAGTSAGGSATVAPPASSGTTVPAPAPFPVGKPKRAPSGLTSTEAYDVALSMTNASGGLDTSDPLERLSVLPSSQAPLLVELGVLKGGKRVLFAVQPGAVVGGPGTCTPGAVDCEILSLGQDQIESISQQSANGVHPVAEFAVTGISAVKEGSAAAANRVRRTASPAGARLLTNSPLSALSLFQYQPSIGAVVDLRNLTVGGS